MQGVISITQPHLAQRRDPLMTLVSAFERTAMRPFTCWHRRMGRPVTRDNKSYRMCLKCGMSRQFDPQTWKSFGPFYCDQPGHRGATKH
jgi:hypothetical protein